MDCRIKPGNDIWNLGKPKLSIGQHLYLDGRLEHFAPARKMR